MYLSKILTATILSGIATVSYAVDTASFYADKFNGRKTASGETFSNKGMTCASNQHKFGTRLQVTNTKTGKSVVCTVNDRIGKKGRVDLTKAAFSQIAPLSAGIVKVNIKILGKDKDKEISATKITQKSTSKNSEPSIVIEAKNNHQIPPNTPASIEPKITIPINSDDK